MRVNCVGAGSRCVFVVASAEYVYPQTSTSIRVGSSSPMSVLFKGSRYRPHTKTITGGRVESLYRPCLRERRANRSFSIHQGCDNRNARLRSIRIRWLSALSAVRHQRRTTSRRVGRISAITPPVAPRPAPPVPRPGSAPHAPRRSGVACGSPCLPSPVYSRRWQRTQR
jgi:hypothetical protein